MTLKELSYLVSNYLISYETMRKRLRSGYEVESSIRVVSFTAEDVGSNMRLLGKNEDRIGVFVYNPNSFGIYLAMADEKATENYFTTTIGAEAEWEYNPALHPYPGTITFQPETASDGQISVTEFYLKKQGR